MQFSQAHFEMHTHLKKNKSVWDQYAKNHDVLYDSNLLRKKSRAFIPKGAFEGCIVKSYKVKMLCINE